MSNDHPLHVWRARYNELAKELVACKTLMGTSCWYHLPLSVTAPVVLIT
mgnify:CR=1 FL=1